MIKTYRLVFLTVFVVVEKKPHPLWFYVMFINTHTWSDYIEPIRNNRDQTEWFNVLVISVSLDAYRSNTV